jgi:hypothetical protein
VDRFHVTTGGILSVWPSCSCRYASLSLASLRSSQCMHALSFAGVRLTLSQRSRLNLSRLRASSRDSTSLAAVQFPAGSRDWDRSSSGLAVRVRDASASCSAADGRYSCIGVRRIRLTLHSPGTASQAREPDSPPGFSRKVRSNPLRCPTAKTRPITVLWRQVARIIMSR